MAMRLSTDAHNTLLKLVHKIQERHRQNSEFRDKLAAIDTEYATQKIDLSDGEDCEVTEIDGIKVPLVGSEVDTITASLATMFVARQPIFPVLATKDNWDEAMMMQALIDRDARLLRWGRQLLLFLNRAARYNVAAISAERAFYRSPVLKEATNIKERINNVVKAEYELNTYTKLNAIDMYNCLYDPRVPPADIPERGEYAGYNEIITRSELKTLGSNLADRDLAYNLDKAYKSQISDLESTYFYPPDVSDYISADTKAEDINWLDWIGVVNTDQKKALLHQDTFLKTTLYVRIIPHEIGIGKAKSPQIYKIICINNEWVISLDKVITPLDALPVYFCDLREDGLGWQTKSPAEQMLPYEDMATELLNTRLQGSRRALADRAIYDSSYLSESQVNSKVPDAKIPIKQDLKNLGDRPSLDAIYRSIPFEGQGVINSLSDMQTVVGLRDQVNGQNFAMRGERQKGNRSASEFQGMRAIGESKNLPYAIRLEEQVFVLMKQTIKINILLNNSIGADAVIDPYTETERSVDIAALRSKLLDFKLTDGLHPKTSLQDPDLLMTMMQTIGANEQFNQEYDVAKVLADILHLANIDVNKYRRTPANAIPAHPQPNPAVGPTTPDAGPATGVSPAPPAT